MATVYLCTDRRSGKQVAVKILRGELGSAVVVERFFREIAFASELDHPRIPRVFDSGMVGDLPFYAMTYVEGESLRARLNREKQLPIEEAVAIAVAVTEPMAYAHKHGIVHRDIKPGNILLSSDGVYVLDFGIARAIVASADESLTSTGVAVGTPAYMSPEQALSDQDLDARSDVYSLGCVTYEMIAGMPPFVAATPQAVMARRFAAPPAPLSETRDNVPPAVEKAVAKALCRAPADRWQTADAFGKALSAPAQADTLWGAGSRAHLRKWMPIAAAAALLLVAAGGAYAWSSKRNHVSRGRNAIAAWDYARAESLLRQAVEKRPGDPAAQLWLAQVLMLRGNPTSDWRPFAVRAADGRASLSPEDQARVDALFSLSSGNADGCAPIRAALRPGAGESNADHTLHLSYADCLRGDRAVLPDSASPSGYRFRASHHQAATIYEGLLDRNAETGAAYTVLMPRLEGVLSTSRNRLRGGTLSGERDINFVAWPVLAGDTVAYVPHALGGTGDAVVADPERWGRVVTRNLERLSERAAAWTRAAPNDPDSHEVLARMLEAGVRLEGAGLSALSEIRIARATAERLPAAGDAAYLRRLRLAGTQVRLLVKVGRFVEAGALADSVLAWRDVSPSDDAMAADANQVMMGLAALTGRSGRIVAIQEKSSASYPVRMPSGEIRMLPPEVRSDAVRLTAYAALSVNADSIVAISARLADKITAVVPEREVADVRSAVLREPLGWAAPIIGPGPVAALGPTSDLFTGALRALSERNMAEARRLARSYYELHARTAPGELSVDAVYQEGWLRAALGDSAGAARFLDNALRGLSRTPANLFSSEVMPAALVRAMILRSELAARAGQRDVAAAWAAAAGALWGRGDPDAVAVVRRLEAAG